MSDYEHGRLYLYERDGETRQAFRVVVDGDPGWFEGGNEAPRWADVTNVRPAIVLDPQDEDVQALVKDASNGFSLPVVARLANKIAAQITPPKPPMEEPTLMTALVEDDRAVWVRSEHVAGPWMRVSATPSTHRVPAWSTWADMVNPRPLDGEGGA